MHVDDMLQYSNSQVCQDLFVLCVLNGKLRGSYVEIGANQPIDLSNTFLLESKFNWSGVSFECFAPLVEQFNRVRRNVCIQGNALEIDLTNIIRLSGFGPHFDYLQLDIDPPQNTLKALKRVDFSRFTFSVITYEHDLYAGGHDERAESRRILEDLGYTRVISDVRLEGNPFEDWWVNERFLPNGNWRHFLQSDISMDKKNMSVEMRELMATMLKTMKF